jgi:hypothetical protein
MLACHQHQIQQPPGCRVVYRLRNRPPPSRSHTAEQLSKTIRIGSCFDGEVDLLSTVETRQIRLGMDGLIHGTLTKRAGVKIRLFWMRNTCDVGIIVNIRCNISPLNHASMHRIFLSGF